MTNLIASLIVTVPTNWSGAGPENKEVGFIQTNYSAQCAFEGKTNSFTLENRFADEVAWRKKQRVVVATNQSLIMHDLGRYYTLPNHTWIGR